MSQWFSLSQGRIDLEMLNRRIAAGDDVAFCSSLNGSTGTNKDGAKIEMWWRATNGFRKVRRQVVDHAGAQIGTF